MEKSDTRLEQQMHLNLLTPLEAMQFMSGWMTLTKCEQNILLLLLASRDHEFTGTNTEMIQKLGDKDYKKSYASAVSNSVINLDRLNLITIQVEYWYVRTIKLDENWMKKIIKIGKDNNNDNNSKKVQGNAP